MRLTTTARRFCLGLLAAAAAMPARGDAPMVRAIGQKDLAGAAQSARGAGTDSLYTPNRSPLLATLFTRLPVGAVTPRGWLRKQLELNADGLCGRMPEISDYLQFGNNGWVDPSKPGWEELPYWLRGYGDLGYVLRDQRITADATRWIDAILKTQQPDGYFGPAGLRTSLDGGPDLWPHMPTLNAMRSYYEFTGDQRIVPFLTRYFRYQNTLGPEVFKRGWGAVRWGDNLDVVYWLYNLTGEPWLLDLATKVHNGSADYTNGLPTPHNVNLAQGIREPAEYWQQAADPKYLKATERNYEAIMGQYGQFAGGGFAGDENVRPGYGDPRQGFETCGIVEFMHTFEMMTRISGDPVWADRCEDLAFNSMPAAFDPDYRTTHYITSANSIQLDDTGKQHMQFQNGTFPMQAFKPGIHEYRCCPHNYGMGWPQYAEEMWLATADRGLCASLYGASEVTAKVSGGTPVTVVEQTTYPFSDRIHFRIQAPNAVRFPLYMRVPGWCKRPSVSVNGKGLSVKAGPSSYIVLDGSWKQGDTVELRLPMQVAVRTWAKNKGSVSVDYGPLTFSLDIKEQWARKGGSERWPLYVVTPGSPWNYGLDLDPKDPARGLRVVWNSAPVSDQPFTHDAVPVKILARGRRVAGWQADSDNVVGLLQQSPARTEEPIQDLDLIPMGAARLRITSFPTVTTASTGTVWEPPSEWPKLAASFVHDDINAVADGVEPKRSSDETIPRFTFWDHKGTAEWVSVELKQPRQVKSVSVYWFDDTGKGFCRVPQSWRVLYRDGDTWRPVEGAGAYGVATDRYNRAAFTPVTTKALRIEVQLQPGFSGGILEARVE